MVRSSRNHFYCSSSKIRWVSGLRLPRRGTINDNCYSGFGDVSVCPLRPITGKKFSVLVSFGVNLVLIKMTQRQVLNFRKAN